MVLLCLRLAHNKHQLFVVNRMGGVSYSSTIDERRHLTGTLILVDIGTRGKAISQLLEIEWLTGLTWLRNPPNKPPEQKISVPEQPKS